MSFKFPHTCTRIDSVQDSLRADVKEVLIDSLTYFKKHPNLHIPELAQDYMQTIYSLVVDSYEEIRKTNSDIREAAEEQIDSMEYDIDELRGELDNANQEVSNLRDEIEDLNTEISDLRSMVADLEDELNGVSE